MSEKLTTEDVEELIEVSNRQIREETSVFYRYIVDEIDWRDRLVCIMGARGVGKTTLMRQRLRDEYGARTTSRQDWHKSPARSLRHIHPSGADA